MVTVFPSERLQSSPYREVNQDGNNRSSDHENTNSQKKIIPNQTSNRYISYESLAKNINLRRPGSGAKIAEPGKSASKPPADPKSLQPDPNRRTVGAVEGRVVGYDRNFNPVTEEGLKKTLPQHKLAQQPVDQAAASSALSNLINSISGKERINQEFFSYLDQKYANASRPPDGMDVYQNPQNYTPEQKLARYIDLVKVKGQFEAYREARLKPNTGEMRTILNEPEVVKDIEQGMQSLLEDPAVAGLLSSEYLQGAREILEGKRFQTDESKYDQAYTDTVEQLRTELQTQFKNDLVDGGIFKDGIRRGLNERSILINYNTALKAFGSVLGGAYVEQHQDSIQKHYSEFYGSKVEPLLPDPAGALDTLIYNATLSFNVPDALKDKIGLVTPTIDGKDYADLGLSLKTENYMKLLGELPVDAQAQKEMASAGLDGTIPKDGLTAAFLPTIANMAVQVFGTSAAKKSDRDSFTSTVLQELRPLMQRLDGGLDPITLGGAMERVRSSLKMKSHPMAAYGNEVTTALNGLLRGANLTGNKLLAGMYRAGQGFALKDVQALTMLAVGYEGKGLTQTPHPEGVLRSDGGDNSAVAKKVFGTENRMWDSGALQQFGTEGLDYYSKKFTGDVRAMLPNSVVHTPIIDATAYGRKAVDDVLQDYATAVAKGLFGNDEAAVKQYATNLIRFTYNLNSSVKAGGFINKMYATAMDLASQNKGYFFEGSIKVDDQMKTMAKYSTVFLSASRTIYGGVMSGGNFNPASLSSMILTSATGLSHVMDVIGMNIKPSMDAKVLYSIGEYADAAKQLSRTTLLKGGAALNAIVDIAWLPVDIYTFVRNLKAGNLDTAEKIFTGVMIASDLGVAVDAGVNLARTLVPATVLQTSRFASLFMGTGGAVMAGVGAAFNLLNAVALIGLNIWQNIKMEKEYEKAGQRLDEKLWPLVGDAISDHLKLYPEAGDPWTSERDKDALYQMHLNNMYKQDVTPFDWNAVRAANRQRFEAAVA